jgi:hypothetical protein
MITLKDKINALKYAKRKLIIRNLLPFQEKRRIGICGLVSTYLAINGYGFSELLDILTRPEETLSHLSIFWWPLTRKGDKQRIKYLKNLIKQLKQQQ